MRFVFTNKSSKVGAEVAIHERVDERVGDVVGEVEIEPGEAPRQPLQRHEEPGRECHNEHDRDDEQHRRRAQVGEERALQLRRLDNDLCLPTPNGRRCYLFGHLCSLGCLETYVGLRSATTT